MSRISRRWIRAALVAALASGLPGCERDSQTAPTPKQSQDPAASVGNRVAIDLFDPHSARDSLANAGPWTEELVEVEHQWRAARRVMPQQTFEWNVALPARARLSIGFALHPEAWVLAGDGIVATVEVEATGSRGSVGEHWICPRNVPAHRGWIDLDLDLSKWSGEEVRLRLGCLASPRRHTVLRPKIRDGGETLLVSRPLIYSAPAESGPRPAPNVLLIVVDTLRRDGLHFSGNPKDVSPTLDALATVSMRFDRAWSMSSWTHPSTATLLSGWTPWQHGLGLGPAGTTRLNDATPLLAEQFQRAGYATAAVSGNRIVSPDEGFARGFDQFDTRPFENEQAYSGQRMTSSALDWIETHRDQPFFAYLHYFDPHDRYQAPAPYTRRYVDSNIDSQKMAESIRQGGPNLLREALEQSPGEVRVRPDEVRYLRGLYDGEIAYLDHCIGQLLDRLREWDLLDRTLLVVTSDHGEEFFEHGLFKHGHSLHEELVAVPLLIKLPGPASATNGRRIEAPVSLLDLAPTLRDLTGIVNNRDARERSWRPLFAAPTVETRRPLPLANFSRSLGIRAGHQRGLIDWPWKWIEHRNTSQEFLFDLSTDPGEVQNLAAKMPDRCAQLRERCTALYGDGDPLPHPDTPIDPSRLEKLKALGYVH